jgi:hypothetical protein
MCFRVGNHYTMYGTSASSRCKSSRESQTVARNPGDPRGSAGGPDKGNSEIIAGAKERNSPVRNGGKYKYKRAKVNKIPGKLSASQATFISVEKSGSFE